MEKNAEEAWAGAIVMPLLAWYAQNARDLPWRKSRDPYRIWVSEIMLQQTRVETVKDYYARFLERLPTLQSLADVQEEVLFKLWEGLGYYSRARNLQKAAQIISKEYGGVFPREYGKIRALPGIGDYTAGAVGSIAFELPTAAVDGNVLRVVARLTLEERDVASPALRKETARALAAVYPPGRCGDFTQSLMELGATVCLPAAPKCPLCPLQSQCGAFRFGRQSDFPVKARKQSRRVEELTLFLLRCGGQTALVQRPAHGLLGGMWEFPNVPGALSPQAARLWLKDQGLHATRIGTLPSKTHVFTHIQWNMGGFLVDCAAPVGAFRWVDRKELADRLALPTAFKKFAGYLDLEEGLLPIHDA